MGERDYNALLYEKVQAEYDAFIEELKTKPVDEVIEKAYDLHTTVEKFTKLWYNTDNKKERWNPKEQAICIEN